MFAFASTTHAQSKATATNEYPSEIREKLAQRYSMDLHDATLLEALFSIRDISSINIVVGNEVTGTVNASFADTTVQDILDSLLITRGYGYRVVGNSLAIVPLSQLGDQLPRFETKIIGLVHSSPDDLMASVESLLSPEGRVHGIASSNSLVVVDYSDRVQSIGQHVEALEQAAAQFKGNRSIASSLTDSAQTPTTDASPDTVRIFTTQYVPATVLVEAVTPLLSKNGQASAIDKESKIVVADDQFNVDRVASALAQLDQPRAQVRIWALIYDCSTDDLQRLGVNWSSAANSASVAAATGSAAQSIAIDAVTQPLATGSNGVLTLTSLNRYASMQSIIQALDTANDSRLLADPNVVVLNHDTAEIAIVTEVPYQQLTQGLEGGTIGTTEFREAGVTLNVTPHIADDHTISLEVNPRFSLLTGFSETDNAPIIDRRETQTTVRVANNQTIVLGGLRQRTRISDLSEIPILGKVPYLGHLFRHRSASTRESELLVFITPRIVLNHCSGNQREFCVNDSLQRQIDLTPTDPVAFGIDTVRSEQKSRCNLIDEGAFLGGSGLSCSIPATPNCQTDCQSQPIEYQSELIEVELIDATSD